MIIELNDEQCELIVHKIKTKIRQIDYECKINKNEYLNGLHDLFFETHMIKKELLYSIIQQFEKGKNNGTN